MRLRPQVLLLPAVLLGLCLFNEARAQTTASGGLTGVVTDPSGAVVPDASAEITDNAKGTTQATKTDREGVYRFFFVAPGRYTLTVTHDGFRTEIRVVTVPLGPPVTVNVVLEIAKTITTVEVTGEAPLIHAENGDVSATMDQKRISEVPNPGNDLTYIAQTAPGVVMNTDMNGSGNLSNFSILGMPGNSYLYSVDGMNVSDSDSGLPVTDPLGVLLGQNQIQEATVVTTGYAGQFGGAAGGNINYITKSGTNEFHGNAQYYWNGRVLNANDWLSNASGSPRPFDIANQWAGSIGGPIKKDKLFFFFDTEGLRLLVPQVFVIYVPSPEFEAATIANIDSKFGSTSASDTFYRKMFNLYDAAPGVSSATSFGQGDFGCNGFTGPNGLGTSVPCALYFAGTRGRPSQDTLTSGRVDWNVNRTDHAFLHMQHDGGHSATYTDPISSVFDADLNETWWQGQLVETHTFGPSAASQFFLAGSHIANTGGVKDLSQALALMPAIVVPVPTGPYYALGAASTFGNSRWRYQLSEDVVKIRGQHRLGFGASFEQTHWTVQNLPLNPGTLTPQTLDAFYQGGVDLASRDTDFTLLSQSFASRAFQRFSLYELGLYGQDEWHARPGLTLTLALRAEHQSNPVCEASCFTRLAGAFESVSHDPNQPYNQAIRVNQKQAFESTDNILWSPRFSFAWQPFGVAHHTVLRGGFGVFYNPVPGALVYQFSTNPPLWNPFTVFGDNLAPGETTNLFQHAAASNAALVDGFAAGKTLAQIQTVAPDFFPPGITGAEKRTHSPQYQRWSLEMQQAFGAGTSLSIGYFGHHGIHELVQDPDVNAFGFGSLPAAKCSSPPVPPCADPRFSGVTEVQTNAVSNYNGMVISFQHRFSRWSVGQFQANYTYGHGFDEVSNGGLFSFSQGSWQSPQDTNNLRGAYGSAEYDVRHSFNASYVWEIPIKAVFRGRGRDSVVQGWQVSGTVFARTGFPYTVFDRAESQKLQKNNYFGSIYAVPVGPIGRSASCGEGAAIPSAPNPCLPPQLLADQMTPNPGALFLQSGCETGFNTGTLGPSPGAFGPSGLASAVKLCRSPRGAIVSADLTTSTPTSPS
jgi:carboxypeptidase family protein